MTFRHVFPLELVLICVFPACTHPRCGCRFPSGCVSPAPPLTAKPGGGASFLRPAHHPASSRFRHTHTASSSLSRTPPPTPSCSRRCLHPPLSGCASARPALLSRRPDGKRGALCGAGAGAFSQIGCVDASCGTLHLRPEIDVWHLEEPMVNDLFMEQLVPAGWMSGWSVVGCTRSC